MHANQFWIQLRNKAYREKKESRFGRFRRSVRFHGRLKRSAIFVVKRFVEQEDGFDGNAERIELASELMKCVGAQMPTQEPTEVIWTQVHFNRISAVEREGEVAYRADPSTSGTGALLGLLGQGYSEP